MALELSTWLPQAQALADGQRKRVAHGCGEGTTLLVESKDTCWTAWCYRCNDDGWHPKPRPSMRERVARLKATEAAEASIERTMYPPRPANFEPSTWPLEARVWLYKAGINNALIKELGIYHHSTTNRVVLPIIENDRLLYWQARGFDTSRPKYLNPSVPEKPPFKRGDGPVLVLTEDILSAVKVSSVTEAWCLMGTSIPDKVLSAIIAKCKPVYVWLDPDGAGIKGRRKFVPKLRTFGIDARSIQSEKDPKYYSQEEIANQLGLDPSSAPSDARAVREAD